jgi:hypothetical protein|tara:strand:+ start:540 stop:989 length:450 start_codon:yes stop_codon:yes gene_type:complete
MATLDNIFGLFSHDENDLSTDRTTYEDLKSSPMYYVGMYKKLILNHINFNKKVLSFFKKANEEFDILDIKEAGEFVTYKRAWSFIQNVDIDDVSHIDALKYYSDEYLDTALELGINFFQQEEEYEKCAILLKILKKAKSLQSKVGANNS